MKINNLPTTCKKYIVARYVDGEYWYWGTFEDGAKAERVAVEIDGEIFFNHEED